MPPLFSFLFSFLLQPALGGLLIGATWTRIIPWICRFAPGLLGMFDRFLIWFDDRTSIPALIHQIRHSSVPSGAAYGRFIPAMVFFTFVLQVLTGLLLWIFYCPSTQTAWESLFYLQFHLPGGWLIRGIHHFAAQLIPIELGLYLLGLLFSGRYRPPYEFVFWTACILLLCSLGSLLTGNLLSWSGSGVSAALIQIRLLHLLPLIGEPLYRVVCGGTEVGTFTLLRFLVLHIMVFAGGFFVLLLLWQRFHNRAAQAQTGLKIPQKTEENKGRIPLFSSEILKYSLAALFVMIVLLLCVCRIPILNVLRPDLFAMNDHLPREAVLGAPLGTPADPQSLHDTARPIWWFRSVFHLSNLKIPHKDGTENVLFDGEHQYIPLFVITGAMALYIFFIPVIGRLFVGHCLNFLAVSALLVSFCCLTFDSYRCDYFHSSASAFREHEQAAARQGNRAVELCLTAGIPPTGVRTLMQSDPFLQGPVLFKRHCAGCHPFEPAERETASPDFVPIPCVAPAAPNLYRPIRKERIAGFLDPKKIRSAAYFGKTKFSSGTMVGFVHGDLQKKVADFESRDEFDKALDQLVDFLASEAQRTSARPVAEPAASEHVQLFAKFACTDCHETYHPTARPRMEAPDLRGYLSRHWLMNVIAGSNKGGGASNNKGGETMPAFYRHADDAVLSIAEIEQLTDWLRGYWHRFQKVSPAEAAMQPIQPDSGQHE